MLASFLVSPSREEVRPRSEGDPAGRLLANNRFLERIKSCPRVSTMCRSSKKKSTGIYTRRSERFSKVGDSNISRERKRNGVARIYISGGESWFQISKRRSRFIDLTDFVLTFGERRWLTLIVSSAEYVIRYVCHLKIEQFSKYSIIQSDIRVVELRYLWIYQILSIHSLTLLESFFHIKFHSNKHAKCSYKQLL